MLVERELKGFYSSPVPERNPESIIYRCRKGVGFSFQGRLSNIFSYLTSCLQNYTNKGLALVGCSLHWSWNAIIKAHANEWIRKRPSTQQSFFNVYFVCYNNTVEMKINFYLFIWSLIDRMFPISNSQHVVEILGGKTVTGTVTQ